jgi:glycosyltransferase involved in cell wall biosynthesis
VPGPYLLAVGELTLRKDYPTLFRAFAQADLPGYRLVVVGPGGFGADQVLAAASSADLGDRLVIVGYASDERLSALYAGASALVLTTREEGFGLPMVEAMARGLPIVASDIDVVVEVAGDAAVLAPVGDAAAFAAGMETVVRDEAVRSATSSAGLARSPMFTWERTVDETIAAYRRALA